MAQKAGGVVSPEKGAPVSGETVVRAGHGEQTPTGAEAPGLSEWISRGF
ncbi:hypothetical protein [Prauserella cavernicola]|uniref:Uncharacterized protein n=1 Tax=Prauserella cavernicola TaxID=2800127 RepID=A0A934V7F8_9PSEU|nr:hypothetical protein [Prauserella cavernicola]MBK1787659.1 hypothetical protein [Prauserella cavernicola]